MTPAERDAWASRAGRPAGSNEIRPETVRALLAEFTRRGDTDGRARRAAADLIRCMDARDRAGAEAVTARLCRDVTGRDLDEALGWVRRLEAERAAERARQAELERARRPPDPDAAAHRAVLLAALLDAPAGRPGRRLQVLPGAADARQAAVPSPLRAARREAVRRRRADLPVEGVLADFERAFWRAQAAARRARRPRRAA